MGPLQKVAGLFTRCRAGRPLGTVQRRRGPNVGHTSVAEVHAHGPVASKRRGRSKKRAVPRDRDAIASPMPRRPVTRMIFFAAFQPAPESTHCRYN